MLLLQQVANIIGLDCAVAVLDVKIWRIYSNSFGQPFAVGGGASELCVMLC